MMKHPLVKVVGAVILLCALLFGFYRTMVAHINSRNVEALARSGPGRLDSIIEAMDYLDAERMRLRQATRDRMIASARLEAALLRRSPAYADRVNREDGMAVRVSDGRVVYPAGSTVRFLDFDALFAEDAQVELCTIEHADSDEEVSALLCACPVEGDRYYVVWTEDSEDVELFVLGSEMHTVFQQLASIEVAHYGLFLKVSEWEGSLSFDYKSYAFPDYATPEALGITREVLEARPKTLRIQGEDYHCDYKTLGEDGRETAIFLTLLSSATTTTQSEAILITAVAGILLVSVAAWLLATQRFVMEKILTKHLQSRYRPAKMRWLALTVGGIGIVALFITGCVVHAISDFFGRSVKGYVSLVMLEQGLDNNAAVLDTIARRSEEWQLARGRHLGEAIGADPDLAAPEPLAEFSDILGTRYIMLFDGDGGECGCSDRYTGFTLGTDPEDSTTDFRRLLLGVPELAHAPAVDERTGLNTRMIGVGCQMPDGRYGALILAFAPDAAGGDAGINSLIYAQTEPGWLTLAFDAESQTVKYASNSAYIGETAKNFGIAEGDFGNQYIAVVYVNDRRCYGLSGQKDDIVYYSICTESGFSRRTLTYGLQAAGGYAVIHLILALYLLFGYTDKWYGYYSVIGSEFDSGRSEAVLPNGRVKRSIDPSRRWNFLFTSWRNMLPEQIAKSVFTLSLGVNIFLGIVDMLANRQYSNVVLSFIISGVWIRGFNLFAIVAILMLTLLVVFVMMLIGLALKLISVPLDTKGETICRLVYNLLQYVAVMAVLYFSFEFLGIDVRAVLAPLALISLALSLGSRQLVEDILAGITIVFEGEYQVGDVVDVGGYRGKVVEVGVRTTKLLGRGDNIKIISNRDVRNVLNMSRMNSWIDMEFTVANTVPMQKIEEIMARELSEIGRSIPDIISGPIYKGIVSMNGSRVTIAVTCECNEEVSFRVQRELYAKFHAMFERENLPLA